MFSFSASLKAQTKASDVPKLVQDLNDKDPAVRGGAAAALDNLHDTAAEPALIAGLKQSSKNVSAATALVRTIGRFNDAKAVAAIAELLPGEVGHAAAAQLLQMDPLGIQAVADATASESKATQAAVRDSFIDAPELGLKVLPATLKNSKSAAQRAMIVSVLADCAAQNPWYDNPPRFAFVQGFLPAATDADPSVRVAVAAAIGQLAETEKLDDPGGQGHPDFGLKETLPVLKVFAADQDADVRTAAIDALGSMANADAISIIKKHLNDPDASVKQHAAEALAAAQAAVPQAPANGEPTGKTGKKGAATPKSAEARELAQIKEWNEEAHIPELIPLLRDPSSLVRAAAADKLGKLDYRSTAMNGADHEQNLSEVPELIQALKDSHALVRAAAAEALGAIGDESAATPLIGLLKDPKPKVVVAAANALSAMVTGQGFVQDALSPEDHKAGGSALVELLATNDQEVRHAAIIALIEVGTVDDMKRIVPLLDDRDVSVRNQTALALARAFYPNPNVERDPKLDALEKAAGPALVAALSVPETRSSAIDALSAMKAPPAGAAHPLIESLKYNVWIHADGMKRPEIQSTPFNGFQGLEINQAIDLLAKTGSPEAEPLLVKFLNIINPDAGKHACAGLATLGDARAVGPLLEVVQRKGVDLQPEAAKALADFQDPRIVPALIQSLQSENYSLRGVAASALGHFHDPRVAPALIHSLTDENADVRLKAAEALGNLGDPAAVEPLARVAKTNFEAVRALGKLKFSGSAAALVSVMQDKQVQYPARGEAVAALAKLGNTQTVPAILQTMEDELASNPSSVLAVSCVHALGAIKDPRAIEPLRRLVGKPTMASQEAERALKELGVSPEAKN